MYNAFYEPAMEGKLEEKASRYHELQDDIVSKQEELKNLQAGTFGTDSEDAEERARSFFSNVSEDSGAGRTEQIDDLREEISGLREQLAEIRMDLWESIADLQLPFEEVIKPEEDAVEFPFSEQVPDEVIDAMDEVLDEDLTSGDAVLTPVALIVETDDVKEAIERAESFIEGLRNNARTKVDIDEYLEELRNRDEKLRLTLYILSQEEPLTKKEIETRMGVESGALRGQLYYIVDNDPYLKKQGKEFSLTETGREVIEGYIEEYGVPQDIEQQREVSQ